MEIPTLSEQSVFGESQDQISSDGAGGTGSDGYMNTISYAYAGVKSYNGVQYAAWVDSNGDVNISERTLPNGSITTHDTGRTTDTTDSHHITSIGFDSSGYIHLCWGMHGDSLKYAVSDAPEDPSSFTDSSMTGTQTSEVTYPRLFRHNGNLYFSARDGNSEDGIYTLKRYDTSTGWSDVAEQLIDGTGNSPYVDNFVSGGGDIFVAFNFRTSLDPGLQHEDYTVLKSTDDGSSWQQLDGSSVSLPITQSNTSAFLAGDGEDVSNQNSLDVDADGNPHVAFLKAGSSGYINYHHAVYDGASWSIQQVSEFTDTGMSIDNYYENDISRPRVLVHRPTGKVFILTRKPQGGNATVYESHPPYSDYTSRDLGSDSWGVMEFGALDFARWHETQTLDLLASPSNSSGVDIYYLDSALSGVAPNVSDENGGGTTTVVEDFEDGDISAYGGDTGAFSVQQSVVHNGSNALTSSAADIASISSTSGLDRYPQPGDTFRCAVRYSAIGDSLRFSWATQSETSEPDRYMLRFNAEGDSGHDLGFYIRDGGSGTLLDSSAWTPSNYTGEWIEGEVQWGSDGSFTIRVFDSTGTQIGDDITASDSTFTSGGIGFMRHEVAGGVDADIYWDYYRVTS